MQRMSLLVLGLCACKGHDPVPLGTDPSDADTELVEDTAQPNPWQDISSVAFSAQFGYDRDADAVTAVTFTGSTVRPTIEVHLGWDGWQGSVDDTERHCTVAIFLEDASESQWVVGDRLWRAFDPQNGDGETDCPELDPSVYGEDVVDQLTALEWGIGVGDLTEDTRAWLEPQVVDLGEYFGGTLHVTDFLGEDDEMIYGRAYAVDAMEVQTDDSGQIIAIPAGQVELDDLATGWYVLSSPAYWTI